MNGYDFSLSGAQLKALWSGALWWPEQSLMIVSDLHLGKSERVARQNGDPLPPYDTRDTLNRLAADLALSHARTVICLGNSFADITPQDSLPEEERQWLYRMQEGRRWVWIDGPQTADPIEFGGAHLTELPLPPLTFRYIAQSGTSGEISGYYHPTATRETDGRVLTRPAFLIDSNRVILPAYGTHTGGPEGRITVPDQLLRPEAVAILTGSPSTPIPMLR